MTRTDFWQIVERVHAAAGFNGKEKEKLLAQELRKLPPEEIISWKIHFLDMEQRANDWDVHAVATLHIGCMSDDSFSDFMCDLVSCGRDIFEAVINHPDNLADFADQHLGHEGYQYVARRVYREITGLEMDFPYQWKPIAGDKWRSKAELQRRFPRMWEACEDRIMFDDPEPGEP